MAVELVRRHPYYANLLTVARLLPLVALQRRADYNRWARRWLLRWMAEFPHESMERVAKVAAVLLDMADRPLGNTEPLREYLEPRRNRRRD